MTSLVNFRPRLAVDAKTISSSCVKIFKNKPDMELSITLLKASRYLMSNLTPFFCNSCLNAMNFNLIFSCVLHTRTLWVPGWPARGHSWGRSGPMMKKKIPISAIFSINFTWTRLPFSLTFLESLLPSSVWLYFQLNKIVEFSQ